ncbi:isoquinoline 1-oxidoreductase subunit beta (plasmid) [Cupriavidus necator N-1]|uniref:Isoquinoline 1-oxidoreductase subunit beta n=1 Tax=Cupriavidus necator (strain ATCC 43291 / DSM 13513 / CCUG 52238 / LMG 8453 / N-1) TaxID=1042878 RepID=F8GX57_CUPNN|nr:molybdopterin cofactor-binding domain-containing protein [Cupriavidus necator]AEI81927.1 isoquinoline 1-oxidoreductase subunit beta [Cupriavidus necator N-1]MDX6008249.1 molybdopterin cofactor-binding domain-containing protein [Cupriavidus necator]
MGRVATITRRTFLIGSAALAGGVAFGIYKFKRELPNPLLHELSSGEAAITPYVKIDANGITLITPRGDKGQGAYSVQAYLLAEELDVDPLKVRLSPGLPDAAYYNGAVLEEAAPKPSYDDSWLAERMRASMEAPAKLLGMQVTGGSSTVRDAFVKLRTAGAVARETLKEAAARQSGVPRDQLKTEDGHVILPDGKRIAYTQLAAAAATLEPVRGIPLRSESQWRYLGKAVPRVDMMRKCTGTEVYGIDFAVEGMVYASVRANPGIGAPVKRFDATKAEKMRGIKKIVPIRSGVGVIADNTWRAFQAVNAIDIEWAAANYPGDQAELWKSLADSFTDKRRDSRPRNDGDVDKALRTGHVIEAEYRVPYLAHAPMEPMNAVVRVMDDRCEIWTGTQIPGFVQEHAAKLTGLAKEKVLVHGLPMGGSFGHRLEDTHVLQAVELAMAVKGTPVKLTWSREEDMSHDYPRPAGIARGLGAIKDGHVEVYDLSIASSSVAASWLGRLMGAPPGPDQSIIAGAWDQPFAIPHYRVSGYRAPETVPVSSWRSVGASGSAFFHDGFLDELIHAAGADPLEERIRLCHHDLSRKVLEAVGQMSGWNGPKTEANRGRGVAFCMAFGVPVAQVIEVTKTSKGIRIDKVFVAMEVGKVLDPRNFEAQATGGIIWGLGHAIHGELTYQGHRPRQSNFTAYESLKLYQVPKIEVRALTNGSKIHGIGEPTVPPAAPALANAIFAATGQRIRELPLRKHIEFA